MKHLLIIISVLFVFQLSAQNAVEEYFPQHLDNQDATVVQVSGKLFQYAAHFVPEDASNKEIPVKNAKEMMSNIKSFVLVKVDSTINSIREYHTGINLLKDNYEELIRVTDKDNNVSLFIDETDDIIHEIVGIVSTEKEFIVAALTGEMKLSQIQNLVSKIESNEMKSILNSSDIDLEDMKVYPNPASSQGVVVVQVPKKMIGGSINVYDMNGSRVLTQSATDKDQKIQTNNLNPGNYIIEVQNAGVILKQKLIVVQ